MRKGEHTTSTLPPVMPLSINLANHLLDNQKLSKVAAPDPFTSSSSAIKEGTRKVGGGNALLSRPGPSKTTFGPPSAGGSKNRFTVRNVHTLHPLYPRVDPTLFLPPPGNSRRDRSVKIVNKRRRKTARNTATVRLP